MLTHRPRIRFGLQARVTLETVIGLTAIFVVIGYVGRRGLANSTQVALEQRLALAQLVAAYVDDHASHVMGELSDAAAEYDVRLDDADPAPELALLADAYRSGYFLQMILTDSRGTVQAVWPQAPTSVAPTEVGENLSGLSHLQPALAGGEAQARWAAELEGRVAERTRQLVDLQRATHRLTADLSLESTLEAMAEESLRLFGADRSATFVLDPASGGLACPIRHGLSEEYVEAVRQNFMHAAGGVALNPAKPVAVPDARGDPRMAPLADFVAREGFGSLLILPMVYRGRVTGAFALYHDRPRDYSPEEISLGEAFAAQAASAVANARLYAELQQRVAELERFNRLAVGRELKMRQLKDRLRSLESAGEARE